MQNGQAGDSPESIDDLAQFLADNPDEAGDEQDESATLPEGDEPEGDESPAEDAEEASEDEPADKPSQKFKVTVKGEDGADQSIEVDEQELVAGYQRHADYTRKTQELSNKEREITQKLAEKHEEVRGHYLQQAQAARLAVLQLAGLKSPEEMAHLAAIDKDRWIEEEQRSRAVSGVLAQIEQGLREEQARAAQLAQQNRQAALQQAWTDLAREGIDRPALESMVHKAAKHYGLNAEAIAAAVDNAHAALVLRDALAYRELKAKKAEVTKKAQAAPALPAARQPVPKQEQRMKALDSRFRSGKAKLGDLAAFLENS